MKENGISDSAASLIEAGYGNTLCSSTEYLPIEGTIRLEVAWLKDGGGDFRLDHSLAQVSTLYLYLYLYLYIYILYIYIYILYSIFYILYSIFYILYSISLKFLLIQ